MEGCYNRPFFKRLRIVVGTPYVPGPPENGEMTREYYKQQCEILYNKTVALRALLAQRRSKRKSKSGKDTV